MSCSAVRTTGQEMTQEMNREIGRDRRLVIALPKGRLQWPILKLLEEADVFGEPIEDDTRKLVFEDEARGTAVILVKPPDVPTYVEYGAADLGVVGKDVLAESGRDVGEILDLGIGRCRMIVAAPRSSGITHFSQLTVASRVATKYPNTARRFFNSHGIQVEVIKLSGSMELAPVAGLSDAIVDITETGRTLAENGLEIIGEVAESTARLIVNKVSYRVHYDRIMRLKKALAALAVEARAR